MKGEIRFIRKNDNHETIRSFHRHVLTGERITELDIAFVQIHSPEEVKSIIRMLEDALYAFEKPKKILEEGTKKLDSSYPHQCYRASIPLSCSCTGGRCEWLEKQEKKKQRKLK